MSQAEEISEYELLRLTDIERNRAMLNSLDPGPVPGTSVAEPKHRESVTKRKRMATGGEPKMEKRTTLSRAAKVIKPGAYKEPEENSDVANKTERKAQPTSSSSMQSPSGPKAYPKSCKRLQSLNKEQARYTHSKKTTDNETDNDSTGWNPLSRKNYTYHGKSKEVYAASSYKQKQALGNMLGWRHCNKEFRRNYCRDLRQKQGGKACTRVNAVLVLSSSHPYKISPCWQQTRGTRASEARKSRKRPTELGH